LIETLQTAVVTFGRFNPPTVAHRHLFAVMQKQMGDKYVFISHSQDKQKNPLSFDEKIKICQELFPDIVFGNTEVKTIIDAATYINNLGYNNLIYVAGGDRVGEFEKILNAYNGSEYNFDHITVINAGERQGSGRLQNISASLLREQVKRGDYAGFADSYINKNSSIDVYRTLQERLLE